MDVKIIRLLTGDDIIGEVLLLPQDVVKCSMGLATTTLKNPMLIGVGQDNTVATAPLSLVAKTDEVTISNNHILFFAEPEDEIMDAYKGRFGGILSAPKGLHLP